jgi:chaperonin GroEL (HSP60 family)
MKDLLKARKRLQLVADTYLVSLISRLVNEQGLDPRWIDIIWDLSQRAHTNVKPMVQSGDKMDILHYVKVKTVPGGKMEECMYIDGVVFMKNVAHKRMNTVIPNARILLLRCPLEYHRVENRLSSLETLLTQVSHKLACR